MVGSTSNPRSLDIGATSHASVPSSLLNFSIEVFFSWAILGLFFFIFVFSTVNSKFVQYNILPMIGFELRTSGIGRNRSASLATPLPHFSQSLFLNGLSAASFCLFLSFQTNNAFFTTNKCEKCPSSIQYWDSNPQPSSHNH